MIEEAQSPKLEARSPKLEARSPKLDTRSPKPKIRLQASIFLGFAVIILGGNIPEASEARSLILGFILILGFGLPILDFELIQSLIVVKFTKTPKRASGFAKNRASGFELRASGFQVIVFYNPIFSHH